MDMMDGWCLKYANEIQWVISFACTDRLYMYRHACTYAGRYASTPIYKDTDMLLREECFSENTLENIDMGNMWQHSSVTFYIEPIPSGPFRSIPVPSLRFSTGRGRGCWCYCRLLRFQVASDKVLDQLLADRVKKAKDKEPFVRLGTSQQDRWG